MRCDRWVETRDGALSAEALELKLSKSGYRVSTLELAAGTHQSDHSHPGRRAEAVLEGSLRITAGDEERLLGPGDAVRLSRGEVHSATVVGQEPAVVLEGDLPAESAERHVVPRLVVLAVLLVLINFWASRHLGFELVDLLVVNAVVIFLPQLLRFLDPREQLTVERFFRRGLWYLAKPAILLLLVLVLAVATLFWSSIEVLPRSGGGPVAITIVPAADGARFAGASRLERVLVGGEERFLLGVAPGGRPYQLRPDGYFQKEITVKPWRQERIPLETLEPLPSVLIRLPFSRLFEGGWIEVRSGQLSSGRMPIERSLGSVVLGARVDEVILRAWAEQWMSKQSQELEQLDPRALSARVAIWTRSLHPARELSTPQGETRVWDDLLQSGTRLTVEFLSARNPKRVSARLPELVVPAPGMAEHQIMDADDG